MKVDVKYTGVFFDLYGSVMINILDADVYSIMYAADIYNTYENNVRSA